MAAYRWHESTFITDVAARHGYRLDGGAGSAWRLHGVTGERPVRWTMTLTPASNETGPRIVWRTTDVRAGADDARRQLVVGRSSDGGTSFGDVEGGLVGAAITAAALAVGGLLRQRRDRTPSAHSAPSAPSAPATPATSAAPASVLGPGWSVRDPAGVLDAGLAPWFDSWPVAWWGPGDERPARLDSVWLSTEGLELAASEWWCSAPALDQLVGLGTTVTDRLRQAFGPAS